MIDGPWLLSLLAVILIVCWAALCLIVSRLGWHRLARSYPDRPDLQGPHWRMPWARVGWANYRGTLKLTATRDGLRLSVLTLLRPGHEPMLLPWQDITIERTQWVTVPAVRLTLIRRPNIGVVIPATNADAIALTIGESWPSQRSGSGSPSPKNEPDQTFTRHLDQR